MYLDYEKTYSWDNDEEEQEIYEDKQADIKYEMNLEGEDD
jgi:hypothetical protein